MTKTVSGTYGSNCIKCDVIVYTDRNGLNWYAVEDSKNVNATYEDIEEGVNVEELEDVDCFYINSQINSEEDIMKAMED